MNNFNNSQEGQQEDHAGFPSNAGRISPLCWTVDSSRPQDGGYNARGYAQTDRLGLPLDFGQRLPASGVSFQRDSLLPRHSDPSFGVSTSWAAANNDLQPRPFAPNDSFVAVQPLLRHEEGTSDEFNLFSLFGSPSSLEPTKFDDESSQLGQDGHLLNNPNQRAVPSKFQKPDSVKISPKIQPPVANTSKAKSAPEVTQTQKGAQGRLIKGMFGSKKAKIILPDGFEPTEYTVILGRGHCNESTGNRRLKALVQSHLQEYMEATGKLQKSSIVTKVMNIIQEACPIGAFVKYENGSWWTAGERASREKVGASFREALHASQKRDSQLKAAQKKARQEQEWSAAPRGYYQPPHNYS